MKGNTQPPIIVPMEDEMSHVASNGYECDDPQCPCWSPDRIQDAIADVPPTEQTLDEQESRVTIGTRVLIEVEIRGFYAGNMMIAGGWMPLSRIKAIVE